MRTWGLTLGSFVFLTLTLGATDADAAKWKWFSRDKGKKEDAGKQVVTRVPPPTVTTTTPLVIKTQPPAPPPKPVITRAAVDTSVLAAKSARFTPGFDAAFKTAVGQIHELANAGQLSAAQDLAVQALHSYMDHNRLDIGNMPAAQRLFAKMYASQAGLNDILMW
jgi:hypothetical protein